MDGRWILGWNRTVSRWSSDDLWCWTVEIEQVLYLLSMIEIEEDCCCFLFIN